MANRFTPLIKGQEIRIDNHLRGVENNFNNPNQDVHLHKTTVVGKRIQIDIRIPLNSNKEATFMLNEESSKYKKEQDKIIEEVNKVLSDKKELDDFVIKLLKH